MTSGRRLWWVYADWARCIVWYYIDTGAGYYMFQSIRGVPPSVNELVHSRSVYTKVIITLNQKKNSVRLHRDPYELYASTSSCNYNYTVLYVII